MSPEPRSATKKAPELFRFDVTRLYCHLRKPDGFDAGPNTSIFDMIFEVQIRTAFEHAWIVATHDLIYKSHDIDWRKVRLASQMKAAVEQLDLLTAHFDSMAIEVTTSPWPRIEERRRVCQIVNTLVEDGIIPAEASPHDMSRFADNIDALLISSKKRVDFDKAIIAIENGLRAIPKGDFPMSASLLQVCMGLLYEAGLISGPFQKQYAGHITSDLRSIFPKITQLTPPFQY